METKKVVKFELKRVLQERGLSQKQLSEMTGLDTAYISRLMRRETISLKTLEVIVNALDLEPHEMAELIRVYQ
ncbi:helix-turn-helix domain-containing protein [Jeotgalibacillus malaysiensis]|uniref:helix-turn-helix domain-containing protein n=1 Tax=Jeotgalibacillus malaysiensis TaxID=1508404 RepID=UPI00384A754E